jgi:Cd2+/Zn2+-exporting ATPase
MPEALRFRVVSGGCVECAGDLRATLLLLPGAEEVEVLGGADVVRVTHDGSLTADAVRAAAGRHHLSLVAEDEAGLKADRPWWADRSVLVIAAAGVLLAGTVVSGDVLGPSIATTALGLSTIVVGGARYLREAVVALGQRRLAFVQLLVVAIVGAVALGVIEEAAALVVVFSLGELVEAWVSSRARRSLRPLMDLVPPTARRRDAQGHEDLVGVRDLLVGDRVLVRPGERIPTDGVVASGASAVDQAAVTGESIPVEVGRGSEVFGGTVNGTGALELEVTHPYRDTLLARIIRQVEDAQANKGSAQRFADRFGARYTPAVVALAAGVAIAGPLATGHFREWIYRSLVVLVVSCSCALLISVPTAVVAAVTRGARDGILIRGGAFLEALAGVRTVAFDKTGTLTEGRPRLTDIVSLDGSTEEEVLRLAAGVEAASEHPLAAAIISAASDRGLSWLAVSGTRADPGVGVHARLGAERLFVGRPDTLTGSGAETVNTLQAQGKTVVMVSRDEQPLGLLAVADRLRADSRSVVSELRRLGVERIVMLTGDNSRSAEAISRAAGLTNGVLRCCPLTRAPPSPSSPGPQGRSPWSVMASTTPPHWP